MSLRKYTYYLSSIPKLLTQFEPPLLVLREFAGRPTPGQKLIRLRSANLQFFVRNKMDLWSLKETFLDQFYERCGVPIQNGWYVVDIGAGFGDFTVFAAAGRPANRVLAFEPFGESFALLKANLALNQLQNIEVFQEAVADKEGIQFLDTSGADPLKFQTTDGVNHPDAGSHGQPVPAISLATLFERAHLETCHLLKLDCEGAEYAILFNTPAQILQRIRNIVMEYHDGVTAHNHTDLARFLTAAGFEVQSWQNAVHADLGYLRAVRK